MFQPIGVAFAATLVAGHFEMAILRRLHSMRCVAIRANRPTLIPFAEQLAMHAPIVGFFDLYVALATGLGDVRVLNRGIAVHAAFDIVNAMTIITGRSDN